jgi:hypothetical protein
VQNSQKLNISWHKNKKELFEVIKKALNLHVNEKYVEFAAMLSKLSPQY